MTSEQFKALFICRGSLIDGLGHIMRTRSVAGEMKKYAIVKLLVIGDGFVENLLIDCGLDYLIFQDESVILEEFEQFRPQVTIFDMLSFNTDTLAKMRSTNLTVSLSPVFNCLLDVDIIFHRTRFLGTGWNRAGNSPLIKSGLQYSVISQHCYRIDDSAFRQNVNSNIMSLAISMGGTDSANKTLQILDEIKKIEEKLLIWVLLGEGYAHSYQDLVNCMVNRHHEIILVKANNSMWRILESCSLVILAGGITTYEAAFAGLPSINLLECPEQMFLIKELVDGGACLCAGHTFSESLNALDQLVIGLEKERAQLVRMRSNAITLIDNKGTSRIVSDILKYVQ